MALLMAFNELSATPIAPDRQSGRRRLEQFCDILVDRRLSGHRKFAAPPYFLQLPASAGYSVGKWLSSFEIENHEKRMRIKMLVDRFIAFATFKDEELNPEDVEYKFCGEQAQGLSLAYRENGIAVSFDSAPQWKKSFVGIEKSWVGDEDVETRTLEIPHASSVGHLDEHGPWLMGRLVMPPSNGKQIWADRTDLFPSLDFCCSVEDEITRLAGGERHFKAAWKGLNDLQRYCESWSTPYFDIHQLVNASGESVSTLNMYSEERTFLCPDGTYRVFEWHLKRWGTRIYFCDFPETKRILVGYVGAHLRISSQ